jgi:hypothetical protein
VVERLLEPDRAALRLSPAEAARYLRLLVFSATHPAITDGRPLPASEVAGLLLDGVGRHDRSPADTPPC